MDLLLELCEEEEARSRERENPVILGEEAKLGEEKRGSNLIRVIGKRGDSWFRRKTETETETETNTHYPLLSSSSSSLSFSFSLSLFLSNGMPLFQSLRLCFISKTDLARPHHAKRNSHLLGLPLQFPTLSGRKLSLREMRGFSFFSPLMPSDLSTYTVGSHSPKDL